MPKYRGFDILPAREVQNYMETVGGYTVDGRPQWFKSDRVEVRLKYDRSARVYRVTRFHVLNDVSAVDFGGVAAEFTHYRPAVACWQREIDAAWGWVQAVRQLGA